MQNKDSPEASLDPVVMYLVVKKSLNMSVGKTAAQVGHCVEMMASKWLEFRELFMKDAFNDLSILSDSLIELRYEYLATSYRKVVLGADDKEFEKLKSLPNHFVVTDMGLTEIPGGSETVVGFWPMRKSEVPKLIKRLQVLK